MSSNRLSILTMWPFGKSDTSAQSAATRAEPSTLQALQSLVFSLPDPIMLIDRGGFVRIANEEMRKLLESAPENRHLSATIRSPAILEALSEALAGEAARQVDYEVRVPSPRTFRAYMAAIDGLGPDDPAVLLQLKDLTREQQIERMRADFVANASHELRTPLSSLSGFIETLMGAARNDAAARDRFLDLMRQQAERMKRLIDDLLSLSRIEMNEHLRPSGQIDMAQVARHVCDVMSGLARSQECEIRLDVPDGLNVSGDRDELVQVLQNLVENAIKYGSTGKFIDIAGRHRDGMVEVSVADHGPGIAPEHLPRLTERFYRVNVQESRLRGGTGLGLAIVKHILNRHRGRLYVESVTGQGSSFSIRIPESKISK